MNLYSDGDGTETEEICIVCGETFHELLAAKNQYLARGMYVPVCLSCDDDLGEEQVRITSAGSAEVEAQLRAEC